MKNYIALAVFLLSPVAYAGAPQFISLSANFDKFVADSANADFETQLQNWQTDIEAQLPDVYAHILGQKRRDTAAKVFPFLFAHAQEIQQQFKIYESGTGHLARPNVYGNQSLRQMHQRKCRPMVANVFARFSRHLGSIVSRLRQMV